MRPAERILALFLGGWVCLGQAMAAEDVQQVQTWLEKTFRAAHTLNYDGTFVYSHNGQIDAMRIVHSATGSGDRERLVSLTGPAREVLRDDNVVTCILPDDKSVVVGKARATQQFPPSFPARVSRLAEYYDFDLTGIERVAGRDAQKLVIAPRDRYRYGYHLWIEKDTGLLLKSELLDERGEAVEQFMFTQIRFLDEVPEELLEPAISGREYTWYQPREGVLGALAASEGWTVEQLPGGFVLDLHRKDTIATSNKPVEHLVYSDGLSSVSVFIEEMSDALHNLDGGTRMGAVNAYGRVLNGYQVTVMGEVPQDTVQLIGDSLRFSIRGGAQ